jgi:hypothetical protein
MPAARLFRPREWAMRPASLAYCDWATAHVSREGATMNPLTTSWRPIAILIGSTLLLTWGRMPPIFLALLLAGGGAYLLYRGWQGWTGRGAGRAIYWRGRRVDLDPAPAGSWARANAGTRWSLVGGAALVLMAVLMLVQRVM